MYQFINKRKMIATLLIFVISLSFLTVACDNREEGKKLADAGITSGEKIAEFYDSLAQDAVDTIEFESYLSIENGTPINESARNNFEETIIAIRKRGQMARRLASSYRSLKDLASYDAGGAVKESATNLADSLKGLPILPGSSVIPSNIIGMLAEDIMDWKHSGDIRKGSKLLLLTLVKIKELMEKEKEAYESISEERGNKAGRIIESLIKRERVTSLPLLQKVPKSLNLQLIKADEPIKCKNDNSEEDKLCQNFKDSLAEIAKVQFYRLSIASSGAASSALITLDGLIESHNSFGKEKGRGISQALAGIERLQAYLDEIKKLRQPSN